MDVTRARQGCPDRNRTLRELLYRVILRNLAGADRSDVSRRDVRKIKRVVEQEGGGIAFRRRRSSEYELASHSSDHIDPTAAGTGSSCE